jgi:hypothetical protein
MTERVATRAGIVRSIGLILLGFTSFKCRKSRTAYSSGQNGIVAQRRL